jgi:hypothetical protein
MSSMSSSSAQWVGWTWWTSGPHYESYMFNLDPSDFSNPVDKPQMATLVSNLEAAAVLDCRLSAHSHP